MIGSARSNKLTNDSEVSIQPYYTHSQGYWLGYEPIDKDKAVALATAMKQACDNNKILYSQPLREEGWKNFKTSIKDIKKITHVDCSSLVRLCIRQAFNVKLPNFNTDSMKIILTKSGLFKPAKRINSEKDCTVGMVLVTPKKGHTAIFLGQPNNLSPNKIKDVKDVINDIIKGKFGNGKERVENLKKLGYNDKEIKEIQKEVNKKLSRS